MSLVAKKIWLLWSQVISNSISQYFFLIAVYSLVISCQITVAADSLKIAAIFSETGIAASHNIPLIRMTKLAVHEINSNGGILGLQVELHVLDNGSTPIGSAVAAQKAIELDVIAVIGALWSSHSLVIAPILQQAGIPMITPGSTNPEVTLMGDYIFRACFVDSFQGVAMAQFAKNSLDANSAAVITNIDEKYSITLARYFREGFIKFKGDVIGDYGYRGTATDYAEIIEKLKKNTPDVIYIPGYTTDSGLFIKQARKMGITSVILGGDGWGQVNNFIGRDINGSFQTVAWHPEVPYQQSRDLRFLYKTRFGREIENPLCPLAFDSVMLLSDAIKRCNCLEREKIKDALAATNKFQGATGLINFDENGDLKQKEIIIVQYKNEEPIFVKTVRPAHK